jgi:hypothetical protein
MFGLEPPGVLMLVAIVVLALIVGTALIVMVVGSFKNRK